MPKDASKDEFSLLVVCWKMSKLGKKPRQIFKMLDSDRGGDIDIQEFIEGMQTKLQLRLSHEDCSSLYKYLDMNRNGVIEPEEFF